MNEDAEWLEQEAEGEEEEDILEVQYQPLEDTDDDGKFERNHLYLVLIFAQLHKITVTLSCLNQMECFHLMKTSLNWKLVPHFTLQLCRLTIHLQSAALCI